MNKLTKYILVIVIILLGCWVVFQIIFYGSISGAIKGCEYSEKFIPVPAELEGATLKFESDNYLVDNQPLSEYCGGLLSSIENTIVNQGSDSFESRSKILTKIESDSTYYLEGIVGRYKHGLSTVDSGKHPIYYLILSDEEGVQYQVSTVRFPVLEDSWQDDDIIISYTSVNSNQGVLTWSYFEDILD